MIPDFKDCTLEERQRYYYNASHCIYCKRETEYVSSLEVYQEYHGMIHRCKHCDAHVGCVPNSDQSLGSVAKKGLRNLRKEAHFWYDPLIEAKVNKHGTKRKQAQAEGRQWASELLGLDVLECHIGYMRADSCIALIEKCKTLYPTEEQLKKKQEDIQYRIDIVHFMADKLGFNFKEFPPMNGKVQMELHNFKKRILYYDPAKKIGRWDNKKKPMPVDDIEDFINEHFQPV